MGPAVFHQPRSLELGVDLAATGLDKYGTAGPRVGLLGGDAGLVKRVRSAAFERGMEARPMLYPAIVRSLDRYRPERVRELVSCTREVTGAFTAALGEAVTTTPVTAQLRGEDILAAAMARAGLSAPPVAPVEATAALAMLLLREYGVLTVHFAGLPPGTSALLIKFVPPETLAAFGGAGALANAVDGCLDQLASLLGDSGAVRALLFG